jgi:hypothetical protein
VDLEGQRRSDNVEDLRNLSPFELWLRNTRVGTEYNINRALEGIANLLTGPEKDTWAGDKIPPPNTPYDPAEGMSRYIEEMRFYLRGYNAFNEDYFSRFGPEMENAHRLAQSGNEEALSGYLYDLDSRGIRLTAQIGQDGKWRMGLEADEFDYAGNRLSDNQIAESRALVESRMLHVFAQSVVEGRPSVAGIAETADDLRTKTVSTTPKPM